MGLLGSDVQRIAHLARLAVNPQETPRYAEELSRILDLVAQMELIDTQGVEPMAHPLHMAQRLRPDVPSEPDQRDRFQAIAPLTEAGLYLVPKVIE